MWAGQSLVGDRLKAADMENLRMMASEGQPVDYDDRHYAQGKRTVTLRS